MSKSPPPIEEQWSRRVSFDFGKGGIQPPKGFSDLSVDDEVTVVVSGKVSSLRQDADTSSFSLRMEKVQLKTGQKSRSMAEILEGKKKSRK
jgi:RPA family protein